LFAWCSPGCAKHQASSLSLFKIWESEKVIVTYHNEHGQEREFPSFKSTVEKPTRTCQREKSCDIIQKLKPKAWFEKKLK